MHNSVYDKGYNGCCSCGICAIICPQKCISIVHNEEGFYRPEIDEQQCLSCGICKKACYQYLEGTTELEHFFKNKFVYGAWSRDEDLLRMSSSGGVGQELVLNALRNGYNVCGVVFDAKTDTCKHVLSSHREDINKFQSSKYLQSYSVDAFQQFNADEKYLVVGTPCQIYGLRKYIMVKGWEENFILIDFFCHGTPSSLLWNKYKEYIQNENNLESFREVLFRSKEQSTWQKNTMKISDEVGKQYLCTESFQKDLFYKFFLSDSCLNPSCYKCLLRLDNCASDIRLADFWGEKYERNTNGVSLVAVNTPLGHNVFDSIKKQLVFENCTFEDLNRSQHTRFLKKSTFKVVPLLKSSLNLMQIYEKTIKPSVFVKVKNRLRSIIYALKKRINRLIE